jgi:hypothetical protein
MIMRVICFFGVRRRGRRVTWDGGWEKVRTKKKPNIYTVKFSYQKTTAMESGIDGTTV